MSESGKGKHKSKHTEFKKGHITWIKGKHFSMESRNKMSNSKKGCIPWNKGKCGIYSEVTINKIRQARMRQCIPKKYTKPELKFMRIIKKHKLPYKYTGDGKFWIENINPDFVQTNGKKICVEIFGDYWHTLPQKVEEDDKKLEILKKYGWSRIVIWEHELCKEKYKKAIL